MGKFTFLWMIINTDFNHNKLITDGLSIKSLKIFMIWLKKENNIWKIKELNIKSKCSNNNKLIEKSSKLLKELLETSTLIILSIIIKLLWKVVLKLWLLLPIYNNNQENSTQDKFYLVWNKLIIQDYNKSPNNSHLIIPSGQLFIDGILIFKSGWIINSKLLMLMLLKSLFNKVSETLLMPINILKINPCLILPQLVKLLKIICKILNPNYHSWLLWEKMVWNKDIGLKFLNLLVKILIQAIHNSLSKRY